MSGSVLVVLFQNQHYSLFSSYKYFRFLVLEIFCNDNKCTVLFSQRRLKTELSNSILFKYKSLIQRVIS